jgi:hypothetical protein
MAEVKILSRVDLIMYPTPETPKRVKAVTYQSGFMPPRVVYIAEEEYSTDKEREVIGKDIEKATTEKPETLEV